MRRTYSEKAGKVPGQQPWVYKPCLDFPITTIPTSRIGFKNLVNRILQRYGPSTYMILREQYEGERPHFRPVVHFQVRRDGKWRILKRWTQYKGTESAPDAFFKQHKKRLRLGMDMKEKLRQMRRAVLDSLKHEVELAKPFQHEIVSHASHKGWKFTVTQKKKR